jgi:hypothetical protein
MNDILLDRLGRDRLAGKVTPASGKSAIQVMQRMN